MHPHTSSMSDASPLRGVSWRAMLIFTLLSNIVAFAFFASPDYYFTPFSNKIRAEKGLSENSRLEDPTQRCIENNYSSYRKLDPSENEIRLVEVAPGRPGEEILCIIGKYGAPWTKGKLNYTAVSYSWGDLQQTREISMLQVDIDADGRPSPFTPADIVRFNVTNNLYNLLERVRHNPDTCDNSASWSERLWIDALSINQNDVQERSEQVALIEDRYSQAKDVQIFLNSEEVPDYLGEFASVVSREVRARTPPGTDFSGHVHEVCEISGQVVIRHVETGETIEEDEILEALANLFDSPWFRRVWVLQEVLKAPEGAVHARLSHKISVRWEDLMVAYNYHLRACQFEERGSKSHLYIPRLWGETLAIRERRHGSNGGIPALDGGGYMSILELFRRTVTLFRSTDPRDKLYAILGLSDLASNPEPLITPDYSLSTSQVYAKFTKTCIRHYGNLDALSLLHETTTSSQLACDCPICSEIHGRGAEDDKTDHPSWAIWPQSKMYWISSNLLVHNDAFRAAGESRVDEQLLASHGDDDDDDDDERSDATLPLRGFFLETVDDVISHPVISVDQLVNISSWTVCGLNVTSGSKSIMKLSWYWEAIRNEYRNRAAHHETCDAARCRFDRYRSDEDLFEAFIETLLCRSPVMSSCATSANATGGEEDGRPTRIWQHPCVAVQLAAHWMAAAEDPTMKSLPFVVREDLRKLLPIWPERIERLSEMFAEMVEPASGRLMFITRRGALGLCPIGTKSSDRPVVLLGGKVPFILRKIEKEDSPGQAVTNGNIVGDGADEWKLIGESYIHGLMDGSRFQKILDEGTESTVFYLR